MNIKHIVTEERYDGGMMFQSVHTELKEWIQVVITAGILLVIGIAFVVFYKL